MARVPKKSSTQTAPPMDKLLKPAVGVAIAMLGYYVMKGSEWMVVFFVGWRLAHHAVFFAPIILSSSPPPSSSSFSPETHIDHRSSDY